MVCPVLLLLLPYLYFRDLECFQYFDLNESSPNAKCGIAAHVCFWCVHVRVCAVARRHARMRNQTMACVRMHACVQEHISKSLLFRPLIPPRKGLTNWLGVSKPLAICQRCPYAQLKLMFLGCLYCLYHCRCTAASYSDLSTDVYVSYMFLCGAVRSQAWKGGLHSGPLSGNWQRRAALLLP